MNAAVFKDGLQSRGQRWYLEEFIDVVELETEEHIGHLLDISEQGIGMVAKLKLMVNSALKLRLIRRISDAAGNMQFIDVKARVRWIRVNKTGSHYRCGLQFEVTDTKSKVRLNQWLQRLEKAQQHN